MTPNPRAKLFMDLRSHLRSANFKFFERPRERQFLLLMRGNDVTVPVVISVRPDGQAFRFQTKVPVVAAETRRVAAAQLVARLNMRTQRGHYDLDMDSGEIDFRIDCHAPAHAVDRRAFVMVLKMALDPVLRDHAAIDAVLRQDADPKKAVALLERTDAEARAAAGRDHAIRERRVEVDRKRKGPTEDELRKLFGPFDGTADGAGATNDAPDAEAAGDAAGGQPELPDDDAPDGDAESDPEGRN